MPHLLDLPVEVLELMLAALDPYQRIHLLHVLGWKKAFWQTVFSLSLRQLCQFLGVVGTRQRLSLSSAQFYHGVIRNWCLRSFPYQVRFAKQNIWGVIVSTNDLHHLLLALLKTCLIEPPVLCHAVQAAQKGHHAMLRWACEHHDDTTDCMKHKRQALKAAFRAGDMAAVDICLSIKTKTARHSESIAMSILASQNLEFIKTAMDSFRPPVDADVIEYAVSHLPLPIIMYLDTHHTYAFEASFMSAVAYNKHLDVIIWCHRRFPSLTGNPEILKIACQHEDTKIVFWLLDNGYTISPESAPEHIHNLQVLQRVLLACPDALSRINQSFASIDVNCPTSTLRWLYEHPGLRTAAMHALDNAVALMDMPLLRRMKEAGFSLRGWQNPDNFWMRAKAYTIDFLTYMKLEGAHLNDHMLGVARYPPLPVIQCCLNLFPLTLTDLDLKWAIQMNAIDTVRWMMTHQTFAANNSSYLLLATTAEMLVCLLQHRDDPIDKDAVHAAMDMRCVAACQIMYTKAPDIFCTRDVLMRAALKHNILILRWCLQTFPASFDEIIDAHRIGNANNVSLYLEQRFSDLFDVKPGTLRDAQRLTEAEMLVCKYTE